MIPQVSKNETRQRVHQRIREKLRGTAERPRLNVYRSLNHIYAQLIDDFEGKTLVSANTREKGASKTGGNVAAAKAVGKAIAERGGYLYHGRVKALADAAREAGLQF
jgi:large subunit ribosomal protein L18